MAKTHTHGPGSMLTQPSAAVLLMGTQRFNNKFELSCLSMLAHSTCCTYGCMHL